MTVANYIIPAVTTLNALQGAVTIAAGTNISVSVTNNTITIDCTAGGAVASVSNTDGTLVISPTTGAVVASLNLSNANVWAALQTIPSLDLAIKGSGAGVTYIGSSNSGASNYTATLPAKSGTFAFTVDLPAAPTVIDETNTKELELTTTGSTTISNYTTAAAGNYIVYLYARVVTASTTLTITVSWTDVTGAQTYTFLNAISEPVGSYTFLPFFLNSATSSNIQVDATAGTANQVYMSSNIVAMT